MRQLWSEVKKRLDWRFLWVALAETQEEFGLVSLAQVADLQSHMNLINVERALEIEGEIHHDLMAELKVFAEQCPVGGGILHLGATSADIEDNADVLRIRQSLNLVIEKLSVLLLYFCEKIDQWADLPIIAYTHLQPAEPSTLGYRLAFTAQDLFSDWESLQQVHTQLRGKGFRGAVGTGAANAQLIGVENLTAFESKFSARLGLPFYPISNQVYPRKQDYQVACALAGLGATLYKFAFDLRLLQSPSWGELSEPFGSKQVGSSAMPFKRNPISAEKIDSLARLLAQMPRLAWDNAAHSLLERTLDDSANRRVLLPEMFLISDEILEVTIRLISDLGVDENQIKQNFDTYGPFAATEKVLVGLGKVGGNRQIIHEKLRQHSMNAWEVLRNGKPNPLLQLIVNDPEFLRLLNQATLTELMDASLHIGDAAQRARNLVKNIRISLDGK
jgi:adenylosuccinate lyase